MSNIDKQAVQTVADLKAGYTLGHADVAILNELARIALASLEAEPVGEVSEQRDGLVMDGTVDLGGASTHLIIKGASKMKRLPLGTKFYAAPPAPVSVPAAMEMDDDFDSAFEHGKAVGWNAYRAAMLQAEPVSNSDELPLDYLQGHKDGLEWAAQLAEANHPQTGDWLYDDPIDLARAIRKGPDMPTVQGGNSPVTPDGWISCSEQMPSAGEQVLAYRPDAPESNDPLIKMATYVGGSVHGHGFDCYCKPTHWMPLPAAPQLEVNRG
ncbi:DUF551 domain-containing protein [Escherichia coli]|uniref:DUF551 domain-containing protein n=1 Tax=Escherichia coli TaxID=562 RepID=UPI0013EEE428|nr:DUF551 domain-containing protein [Escherichia coli]EFO3205183.1 DUF551 domain-containing protein [Escherichia coli]EKP4623935.1 DUF551 domain-containing protein [Escherichia coli]ELX1993890.1 DUF551 domain-containing protein [Escherichia coli]MBW8674410.1 DUF551 domain-containing protein [Escherichia coli]MDZ9032438.1 DUF551 domain-containing protein [Escherichia coli]